METKKFIYFLIFLLGVSFLNFSICLAQKEKSASSGIQIRDLTDRTEKVQQLWGVGELQIEDPATIIVKHGRFGILLDSDGERVKEVKLKVGDEFQATGDRHIVRNLWKFLRVQNGHAIFREESDFNAMSFGNGLIRTIRIIEVAPYSSKMD